jgi:periplasmic nitrate reductase NapE
MNDNLDPAARVDVIATEDPQRKREEFRAWSFLSFVMAPLLSVLIVAGYGFLVWMYQLLAGPPAS